MKLLYLSYARLDDHSAEGVHIRAVTSALAALGHEVLLIVPARGEAHCPPGVRCKTLPTNANSLRGLMLYQIILLFVLPWMILRFRPAVIYSREIVFCLVPIIIARLFRVPYVVEINGYLVDELRQSGASSVKISMLRRFQQVQFSLCDHVVAVADGICNALIQLYGISKSKITVIPNGVDTSFFFEREQEDTRRKLGILPDAKVVGFVGGIYRWQNLDRLIRAVPLILERQPDVRFRIIGDGPSRGELVCLAVELGCISNVDFVGSVPHDEIPIQISAFDIGVSLRTGSVDIDGPVASPLKLFEYMACSRPVVVAKGSGYEELITANRIGRVACIDDPSELARCVVQMLEDGAELREMGVRARRLAEEKFTWQNTARKVVNFCAGLARRGGGS